MYFICLKKRKGYYGFIYAIHTGDIVDMVNWHLPEVWELWDSSEKVLEDRVPHYLCETSKVEKESYRLFQKADFSLLTFKSCLGGK